MGIGLCPTVGSAKEFYGRLLSLMYLMWAWSCCGSVALTGRKKNCTWSGRDQKPTGTHEVKPDSSRTDCLGLEEAEGSSAAGSGAAVGLEIPTLTEWAGRSVETSSSCYSASRPLLTFRVWRLLLCFCLTKLTAFLLNWHQAGKEILRNVVQLI